MDNLTLTAENGVLSHIFGTTFNVVPPIQVALVTELGTDVTLGTEASGLGYARQDFIPTLASSGYVYNATQIVFTNMPTCAPVGLELWDSDDHRLWHGPLSTSPSVNAGETFIFPPSSIVIHMGGAYNTRTTAATTATIDPLSTWVGSVSLGRTYRLLRVECDKACRVRLYSTFNHLTTDINRPIGTRPRGDHGLTFEYVADATHLAADLSPQPEGSDLELVPTGDISIAIQNLTGAINPITATFTYLRLED